MAEERVQRRLAAILAADVVGYSRLVEPDEAGTIARLKTLQTDLIQPLIAENCSRVVKVMGDGVLVEFGSAVDAVRNAPANWARSMSRVQCMIMWRRLRCHDLASKGRDLIYEQC